MFDDFDTQIQCEELCGWESFLLNLGDDLNDFGCPYYYSPKAINESGAIVELANTSPFQGEDSEFKPR